jgi:hypothetical protein
MKLAAIPLIALLLMTTGSFERRNLSLEKTMISPYNPVLHSSGKILGFGPASGSLL